MAGARSTSACHSVTRISAKLLLSFFAFSSCVFHTAAATFPAEPQNIFLPPIQTPREPHARNELHLRQIFHHGTRLHPTLHRKLDIAPGTELKVLEDDESIFTTDVPRLWVKSHSTNIHRLVDRNPATLDALQGAGQERGTPVPLSASAWTVDTINGPNYTDKETVLSFIRMASNAYVLGPDSPDWLDVGGGFNYTEDFGWQADGLRGHIFADTKNQTVVIGLKGTSPAVFDGEGTTTKDKINDNLFFSCCCGQGGSSRGSWLGVCDCKTATYTCNGTCLSTSLREKDRYYGAGKELYNNVTALYPNADIWLTGHSLGGAVASLIGLTYGVPVITFGAPGDAMPARRLGLPTPPQVYVGSGNRSASTGGIHFGHTADPIFMGTCNGWTSTCSIGGYAMESVCHTGRECVYDTVKEKGWHNQMMNHRVAVTMGVLESYPELAPCAAVTDCYDCYNWKYFESNHSEVTTSTTTTMSFTQTRTQTCKSPGWWGCLDESTTSSSITSTVSTVKPTTMPTTKQTTTPTTTPNSSATTSRSSTSSCKTPGWFGCRDPVTTTATTASTKNSKSKPADPTSPSETCEFLGLFFCHPCSTTMSSSSSTTSQSKIHATPAPTITTTRPRPTSTASSTSSCRHPGLFGGCYDLPDDPWFVPREQL